jgi:hypothetical protein
LSVPADAATGAHLLHLFAGPVEAPVPVQVLVSDTSELLSSSAPRSAPQTLALPAAVSGVLSTRKAAHYYSIDAQAGERIAFEVDAMKLGYLVDPVLAVYASDGKLVASADDRVQQNGAQPPNLDPYLVHKFEQAGRYAVMIRDMAERSSPDYVYRLWIYRTEPDFDWKTLQPSISIYTGMKSLLAVRVRRLGGWDTPIDVWLEDLPPGVTAEKQTAEPKDTIVKDNCALERKLDGTDVYIPVIAAKDATPVVFKPKLRARGTMDGKTVEHTAEVQFLWESAGKVSGRTEDQTVIATVSPAPALMLEAPGQVSLTKGKPARVRVLVKRFDGSTGPLRLELDKPVSGLTLENTEVAAGASQVTVRLTADPSFRPATIKLRSGLAVSPPIELKAETAEESDR